MKTDYQKPVFVFGSNLAGAHGGGAARDAYLNYGAVMSVGRGLQGQSYAIPTKDYYIKTLPLVDIAGYVKEFLAFARSHQNFDPLFFNVTRIGCGLAGYKDADIAPMFADSPTNCNLPCAWYPFLWKESPCSFNWDKDFNHG